jgi:DHA1 family bicyclomycin/chloramphenicol resistance-like MFS transporter
MKPSGRHIWITLLPLVTISFVSHVAPYIYIPSLPDIAGTFAVTESQVGNTMSIYYLALSLTLLAAGAVGDVWNKKRMLTGASFLIFAGAVIAGFADRFGVMLSGWAMQAVGAAMIVIVGQTWIGQRATKSTITSLYAGLSIILSFAPLIAPILGGAVNDLSSWRYNFYIVAVLSLLAAVFIGKSTPPPPDQAGRVSAKEVMKSYGQLLFKSKFTGLISTSFCLFIFQGAIMNYSSFLFIDQLGVKPSFYGLISIPVVAGIVLGQVLTVSVEKRRGGVSAHLSSSIICLTALLASIVYYMLAGSHSIVELGIVIFIFNVGFGGHTLLALRNVMLAFASRRSHASALTNFMNQFAGYIASLLVQLLFAIGAGAMQVHNAMCLIAIILIFATFPVFKRSYQD